MLSSQLGQARHRVGDDGRACREPQSTKRVVLRVQRSHESVAVAAADGESGGARSFGLVAHQSVVPCPVRATQRDDTRDELDA